MKLLIFEAIWCRDCQIMKPMWRNFKVQFPELDIQEVDCSENSGVTTELMNKFNILDLPVCIFLNKNNEELARTVGVKHRDELLELINKYQTL
jgi:thiol:disulfide interchange protein